MTLASEEIDGWQEWFDQALIDLVLENTKNVEKQNTL